jgi:hypothetical protein
VEPTHRASVEEPQGLIWPLRRRRRPPRESARRRAPRGRRGSGSCPSSRSLVRSWQWIVAIPLACACPACPSPCPARRVCPADRSTAVGESCASCARRSRAAPRPAWSAPRPASRAARSARPVRRARHPFAQARPPTRRFARRASPWPRSPNRRSAPEWKARKKRWSDMDHLRGA